MADRSKGLFVDLDGTLADSLPVMRLAYAAFLNRFGKVGSDAEFDRLNGPTLAYIVASLAENHGLPLPADELIAVYRDTIRSAYKDVSPHAGAKELLETATGVGLKICVVTSNSGDLAWTWLRHVGLREMVDAVVAGNEVSRGKPHPTPYLLALAKTSCLAEESLAVEDSIMGVRSALAAGIQTFFLSEAHGDLPRGAIPISKLRDVTALLIDRYQEESNNGQ